MSVWLASELASRPLLSPTPSLCLLPTRHQPTRHQPTRQQLSTRTAMVGFQGMGLWSARQQIRTSGLRGRRPTARRSPTARCFVDEAVVQGLSSSTSTTVATSTRCIWTTRDTRQTSGAGRSTHTAQEHAQSMSMAPARGARGGELTEGVSTRLRTRGAHLRRDTGASEDVVERRLRVCAYCV